VIIDVLIVTAGLASRMQNIYCSGFVISCTFLCCYGREWI